MLPWQAVFLQPRTQRAQYGLFVESLRRRFISVKQSP